MDIKKTDPTANETSTSFRWIVNRDFVFKGDNRLDQLEKFVKGSKLEY